MKNFILNNKVFLTGLLASIGVVLQQFLSQPTIDWKVIGYAALMSVLSYLANTWRGQGVTVLGIFGTLAGTFVTVSSTGTFSWNQFFISAVAAVLASVAPPPKDASYEKTPVIANAKKGFSETNHIVGIPSIPKDSTTNK